MSYSYYEYLIINTLQCNMYIHTLVTVLGIVSDSTLLVVGPGTTVLLLLYLQPTL